MAEENSGRALRIAVVGTGRISKFHFAAWRAVENVAVVAVCDIDFDRAKTMADRFGVAKAYGSLTELLDREQVDALDIATPPATHGELLAIAAAYKIDCLCQKPLARDYEEAVRIVADAAGKIRLCVNENRRHLPYYRTARQWIAEGLIGTVQQGSMTAFRSSFLPGADGKYSGTPLLVKGPRLFISETLVHQIDALRSMLGNVRLIASRAVPTEAALEGDTICTLMLETTDGAPLVLSGSGVAIGYPREFNDRFEILGSKGSISWDGNRLRLLGPNEREEHFDMQARYDEMYQSCFTTAAGDFADAVRSGKPFPADATDNLATLKIVEDAYRLNGALGPER